MPKSSEDFQLPAFAKFVRHNGQLFRFDTRIYLDDGAVPSRGDRCIAAIVAKNPGSAQPTKLGELAPLLLAGDRLIPYVRKRFREGYKEAGVGATAKEYVRVCNLFYLCNKNLRYAVTALKEVGYPPEWTGEPTMPPLVWFAWGGPDRRLDAYKMQFLEMETPRPFFYETATRQIASRCPTVNCKARHTQGMRAEPVVAHLAMYLKSERGR